MLDEISPSFPRLINNGNKDKIVQLGRIKIIIVSFQKKKILAIPLPIIRYKAPLPSLVPSIPPPIN